MNSLIRVYVCVYSSIIVFAFPLCFLAIMFSPTCFMLQRLLLFALIFFRNNRINAMKYFWFLSLKLSSTGSSEMADEMQYLSNIEIVSYIISIVYFRSMISVFHVSCIFYCMLRSSSYIFLMNFIQL
ncbi:hypothetical protein SAY87_008160 [Trapa incisa]|uniref:Uncharacterized protein n=1 Tax=Trapa incisa TaxID=236973 RepID=A0AAN7QGF3_9MYRT|nr:hypothetical protein SAY87_008160 [Trapa incisa]